MTRIRTEFFAVIAVQLLALLGCGNLLAEDAKKTGHAEKKPKADGPTHQVKKESFKIEVKLKGVLAAGKTTEMYLHPEAWSRFVVLDAVAHGSRVQRGDRLVSFDTKGIDKAIRDLEAQQELNALGMKQAEEELRLLEKVAPFDLETAKLMRERSSEDQKLHEEEYRKWSVKASNKSVQSSEERLEYELEELKQLEKMYKADDLTEETEEIILKRQQNWVNQLRYYLERTKNSQDRLLNVSLPRTDEDVKRRKNYESLNWERISTLLPLTLSRARLDLAKRKYDHNKGVERLAKLREDREGMEFKAPSAGYVYYGESFRGNWVTMSALTAKLRRGGKVMPHEVIVTIVESGKMTLMADVPEKELAHLRSGISGVARPTSDPDRKILAKLERIAPVAVSRGKFGATISVKLGKNEKLTPGMTCNVKFVPYSKKSAIAVPSKAVFTDEIDDDLKYVLLIGKDGSQEKRTVTVGKKSSNKTEILKGLKEGDIIALSKPKEQGTDSKKGAAGKSPAKKGK